MLRMKVYLCQIASVWEDKPANFLRVTDLLAQAQPVPGSLVVLPEMFATGFSMNADKISERVPDETDRFLVDTARRWASTVVAGLPVRDDRGRFYNEAAVVTAEGVVATRYHKLHPFALGGESTYYHAGDRVVTVDLNGWCLAPFVCYDLRFPEVFRMAVRQGATLMVVIANWPTRRIQHWLTLLQARAIENQSYVVGVNRSGQDPQHAYPGRSVVVDPHGVIVADAGDREKVMPVELDLGALREWRRDFPALQDLRPEFLPPES